MKKSMVVATSMVSLAFLYSCGGGGGAPIVSGFSQDYTTSAGIGELMTYSIDTTKKTYSYTITQSSYGLTGHSGSGTLTLNSDGSYTPSESPTSRVHALQNGMMVGGISLNIGGAAIDVPIFGASNPVTSIASLAGTYNYISHSCPTAASCSPTTSYGTIKIDNVGNYTQCVTVDITTNPACNDSTGTITAGTSNGLWKYVKTGSNQINYLFAFTSPNNQNVLVVDFNDNSVNGYGYGQAIASTQVSPAIGSTDGVYTYLSNNGDSGTLTVTGTSASVRGTDRNGNSGTNTLSATVNSPWAGMVTATHGGGSSTSILAGTGVYIARANNVAGYYEIGLRH